MFRVRQCRNGVFIDRALKNEPETTPTIKEFLWAQRDDSYCPKVTKSVGEPGSDFTVDRNGILVRVAKLKGAIQKVTPFSMRARFLCEYHY